MEAVVYGTTRLRKPFLQGKPRGGGCEAPHARKLTCPPADASCIGAHRANRRRERRETLAPSSDSFQENGQRLLPHSLLQMHASSALHLTLENCAGNRCFAGAPSAPSDVRKPRPADATQTGSVHRHHVATGERPLGRSRVATSKLLSKGGARRLTIADERPARCRRGLDMNPRRPFRSWRIAPVTSRSAKRVATALPRRRQGQLPSHVWTFAQNTAPALAGVLLRPHSQSPGQSARMLTGGHHPAIPRDFPRLVIGVESIVRSLDGPPVRS